MQNSRGIPLRARARVRQRTGHGDNLVGSMPNQSDHARTTTVGANGCGMTDRLTFDRTVKTVANGCTHSRNHHHEQSLAPSSSPPTAHARALGRGTQPWRRPAAAGCACVRGAAPSHVPPWCPPDRHRARQRLSLPSWRPVLVRQRTCMPNCGSRPGSELGEHRTLNPKIE